MSTIGNQPPASFPSVISPVPANRPVAAAPSHQNPMKIDEVPRTPPPESPTVRHGKEALDAARNRALLLVPEYVRGKMPRLRLGESRQWYALKDELKRTFIHVQWNQFLEGKNPDAQATRTELTDALNAKLESQHIQSESLLNEARQYIERKANDLQFRHVGRSRDTLTLTNGVETNFFLSKGTNLVSDVIRTERGNFYQIVTTADPKLRRRIEDQERTLYRGGPKLKIKGAFGKIRLAERLDEQGSTVVAAKTHRKGRIAQVGLSTEYARYQSLPATKHFSSVHDLACVTDHKGRLRIYLFMDLQIRGDMVGVLTELGKRRDLAKGLQQKILRTVAYQMIEAVQEMHEKGIAHRDIKPDNFLLSKDGAVVATDFGTAARVFDVAKGHTDGYIPPEHGDPGSTSRNGDIYALGHTLSNICRAFPGLDPADKKPLLDIAGSMTLEDPDKRASLPEALAHPFFAQAADRFSDKELLDLVDGKSVK